MVFGDEILKNFEKYIKRSYDIFSNRNIRWEMQVIVVHIRQIHIQMVDYKKNGKHTNRIIRFIYTLSGCRRMQTMNNVDALGNLEFQINWWKKFDFWEFSIINGN